MTPDVIVVGAGIIGCAVARELARRGVSVRLFESRTIGAGATQASAGVLAPYIEAGEGGPLFDLAVESLAMYDDFVRDVAEDSGIEIEYRRCGTLEVAGDDETIARFQQRAQASGGRVQWLDAGAAEREVPALAPVLGALLVPEHGCVDAPVLTEALAWAAMRHGAKLETGQRVEGLEIDGRRTAVRTSDGTTWAPATVVIAAGSWSTCEAFGAIPAPEPVVPIRGQLLRLRTADAALSRIVWGPHCYIVPRAGGLVLVGATMEDVGFDERTTAAGVRDLLEAACDLVPALWRASFVDARAGLRPATASGRPIIQRAERGQVVFATGHFRNGVLLAPLTAKLVADLVSEQ